MEDYDWFADDWNDVDYYYDEEGWNKEYNPWPDMVEDTKEPEHYDEN